MTSVLVSNSNTALGITSLYATGGATGSDGCAVGYLTLQICGAGGGNTAIGSKAMNKMTVGTGNTSLGAYSLFSNTGGTGNVAIGNTALFSSSGSANTAIGFQAGYTATGATGCVYLGFKAGYSNTGSNQLFIANNATGTPLIGGDFETSLITITGRLVATSTGTFSNINLSDFTFTNSLACAATTYSGAGVVYWQGMNSNVDTTMYFSRFGHLVMLRLPTWTYPNTSTTQVPTIAYNPGGWAPTSANMFFPVIANHGNSWVRCILLVNTNCTVYLYSPIYATQISATNAVNAFPGDCCVAWSRY